MEPDSTAHELVSELMELAKDHPGVYEAPLRFLGWVGDNDEPIVFNEYLALSFQNGIVEVAIGAADGS